DTRLIVVRAEQNRILPAFPAITGAEEVALITAPVKQFEVDSHQRGAVAELYDLSVGRNVPSSFVEPVNHRIASGLGPGAPIIFGEDQVDAVEDAILAVRFESQARLVVSAGDGVTEHDRAVL